MSYNEEIELYLYIDIGLELYEKDIELIKKCINLHLFTQYNKKFSKFVYCNDLVEKTSTEDVIKNGLITFHNMFKKLKLKGKNTAWFMYLSNGDIQNKYKNVSVLLLNTQPNKKECFYSIDNSSFELNVVSRDEKLTQFKNLSGNLRNLFSQINDEQSKKIYY